MPCIAAKKMSLSEAMQSDAGSWRWASMGPRHHIYETKQGRIDVKFWESVHGRTVQIVSINIQKKFQRQGLFSEIINYLKTVCVNKEFPDLIHIESAQTAAMFSWIRKHPEFQCSVFDRGQAYCVVGQARKLELTDAPESNKFVDWMGPCPKWVESIRTKPVDFLEYE